MSSFYLHFILKSDATFGRGDGVAGLVDIEVQHDENGCPYLGGRALKGMLVSECADLLAYLPKEKKGRWEEVGRRLFGEPGSTNKQNGCLSVGDAHLPDDLRKAIALYNPGEWQEILESLTTIRKQTAMDENGVPRENSLRSVRVILRETPFTAELVFINQPQDGDLALLAACIKAFRRAGTSRNRGRGRLQAELQDAQSKPVPDDIYFAQFVKEVRQ